MTSPLLEGLDVELADQKTADIVLLSGLYDDTTETPQDYIALLETLHARDMPMICANPDIKVERGERLVYCAGAIAKEYERLGGEVIYAGKPYPPIYHLAFASIAEFAGQQVPRERILAIGDGVKTDIAGAHAVGLDSLFIASGLHIENIDREAPLDRHATAAALAGQNILPVAAQAQLCW